MIRNDFVSNSSSCSFIIHLQSRKDVDEFTKIFNDLFDLSVSITILLDPDTYLDYIHSKDDISKIKKGDFVKLDAGEDHYQEIIDKYDRMCELIDNCGYKFKEYLDPDAHYTRGVKWREKW